MGTQRIVATFAIGLLLCGCSGGSVVGGGGSGGSGGSGASGGGGSAGAGGSGGAGGGGVASELDASFGDNGVVRLRSSWSTDEINAAARTSDGGIIAVGSTGRSWRTEGLVARVTPAGSFDTTFGTGGVLLFPLFTKMEITDVVGLTANSAVFVGHAEADGDNGQFIARIDAQGALDASFGSGGIEFWSARFGTSKVRVALAADGSFIVAGPHEGDIGVRQFDSAGVLDTSYGTAGVTVIPADEVRALIPLPNQQALILIEGTGTTVVRQLNADGSIDTGFGQSGAGGRFVTSFEAWDMLVDSNGDILVAGGDPGTGALLKLDASGAPVATFGTTGIVGVAVDAGLFVARIRELASGEIMLGAMGGLDSNFYRLAADGSPLTFGSGTIGEHYPGLFATILADATNVYIVGDADGAGPDNPFGTDTEVMVSARTHGGAAATGYGTNGEAQAGSGAAPQIVYGAMRQSDDKILMLARSESNLGLARFDGAVGGADTAFGSNGFMVKPNNWGLTEVISDGTGIVAVSAAFTLRRLELDGSSDTTFGTAGTTDVTTGTGSLTQLGIDSVGRIVGVGTAGNEPLVARTSGAGIVDTSFGNQGLVLAPGGTISAGGTLGTAWSLLIEAGNKVVVAGEAWTANSFLFRLNEDGSLDTTFGTGGQTLTTARAVYRRLIARQGGGYLAAGGAKPCNGIVGCTLKVIAFDATGAVDTSFGTAGVVSFDVQVLLELNFWTGMVQRPNGDIVVAGAVDSGFAPQLAVWMLDAAGSPVTDFGNQGQLTLAGPSSAMSVIDDGDGFLVVGTGFDEVGGSGAMLVRFTH